MSTSKRERKRLRKELVRKHERRRTLLGRGALVCGGIGVAGLVAATVLSQFGHGGVATWIAGPTGVVILLMVGFLVAKAIVSRRQKRRTGVLGWIGLGFACVAGLQLMATQVLLLAGRVEASQVVGGLTVVPVLFTVGFLIAEWTKDVPAGSGYVDTTSYMHYS